MHLPVTVTWAHRDGDFFDDGDDDDDNDDDDNDDDDDGMLILGADGGYM